MAAMQGLSAIITMLGLLLTITAVVMPRWMKNDPFDTINDNNLKINGLWIKCTLYKTGNWDCDDYDRFILGLPARLQAGRILGVASIFFGFLGFILTVFGMNCVPVGGERSLKSKLRLVGGCLTILGGGLLMAITSWFANDIRIEHNQLSNSINNSFTSNRAIFGEALFIGWAASILSFVGGCCALCTSCSNSDDDDFNQTRGYIYRPPPIKTSNVASQEYV